MVKISALSVEKSLRDAGVDLIKGEAKILSPEEVEWTSTAGTVHRLSAEHIVIAWGSKPALPPGLKLSKRIITSDGFFTLNSLPESFIILGGSAIGLEFATFLAELGVRVNVIELLERILPREEDEASSLLNQELTRIGITIHTSTRTEALEETADGAHLQATRHDGLPLELKADYALICTGRKPYLRSDELERCGIHYDHKGIGTDSRQMTNVRGIYAVGDVTGGIMFAHKAIQQGKAFASHLYGDRSVMCREEFVPSVVYTHPNVARIGLTEKQAIQQGLDVESRKVDYAANIIARTELKGNGFVKAVFSGNRLIGVTIVGDNAGELIASMTLALASGIGKNELRNWIIPHPTLGEILHIT